jgi:N-succinyldiaminopimelate aminotransferase
LLPGSFVAREAGGMNPGRRRVRLALVATQAECAEAVDRLVAFTQRLVETRATA